MAGGTQGLENAASADWAGVDVLDVKSASAG
jgi:hypothetical protein